ncbi:helix-turn-helix transcriptional regulator [Mesorhizobium sp. WSM4935]|uniref:helix-turn-helix domain-containing protein n=1 Tax=Mesorhizobium sp. WSM4935 TaxID=3038547 RepID=UPI0024154137|nr:helix-turn-helix transcriptional regulator [Mesorhizobium sp. WSM4935]MDG4874139.1 helix-turn-helix transcriptional regulator [Mesorhizobium sp. WSM4935]
MENLHQLTKWRLDRNLSTADVGRMIDCTRLTVDRYEAGRMPRQPYLDRIVVMSDGEVNANHWLGKEAADVVARRRAPA